MPENKSQIDLGKVAEWVGLHYGRNFDAESAQSRQQWIDRYAEQQCEAPQNCDDCDASTDQLVGCPDGAEVCTDCFDMGAH